MWTRCLFILIFFGLSPFWNASFESPDVTGSQGFFAGNTIGIGWLVDSSSKAPAVVFDSGAFGGPTTHDGGQYLLMDSSLGGTAIYQDIAVNSFTQYRLAWELGTQPPGIDGEVAIDIISDRSSLIGGPRSFFLAAGSPFTSMDLSFATQASADIRLRVIASGKSTSVDAFSLTSVPEPSSSAQLIFAMGAFVFPIRKRSRTAVCNLLNRSFDIPGLNELVRARIGVKSLLL
jgi:hypothetical protein